MSPGEYSLVASESLSSDSSRLMEDESMILESGGDVPTLKDLPPLPSDEMPLDTESSTHSTFPCQSSSMDPDVASNAVGSEITNINISPKMDVLSSAMAGLTIKTYADATNIATLYPELAPKVLTMPLIKTLVSSLPSSTVSESSDIGASLPRIADKDALNIMMSLPEPCLSYSDERPNWALALDPEDLVKPKSRKRTKLARKSSSVRDMQRNRAWNSPSSSPSFVTAGSNHRAPSMNSSLSRSQESDEYTSKYDYGLRFHYKDDSPPAAPYMDPLVSPGRSVDPDSHLNNWRSISLKKPLPPRPILSYRSQHHARPSSSEEANHHTKPTTYALLPSTQPSTSVWATTSETSVDAQARTDLVPAVSQSSFLRSESNYDNYQGLEWHDSGGMISPDHISRVNQRDDHGSGSYHPEDDSDWMGSLPTFIYGSSGRGNHSAPGNQNRRKVLQSGDIPSLAPEEIFKRRRINVDENGSMDGSDGYRCDSDEWKGSSLPASAYGTPLKRSKWKRKEGRGSIDCSGDTTNAYCRLQHDHGRVDHHYWREDVRDVSPAEVPSTLGDGRGRHGGRRGIVAGLTTSVSDPARRFSDELRLEKSQSEPDLIDFTSELCIEPAPSTTTAHENPESAPDPLWAVDWLDQEIIAANPDLSNGLLLK
ncbi:hypothetical protein D9757_001298 [Collybiopsis confluens]|uniref:Uncharacterized protein n=1 Tax=Collybiopsis confluens TaxID=2823264 RepID=A0A8H5I112_9AGAR|nr:hypothetical protein D9757_001298 [Collybiopsis confluens]